MRVVRQHRGNCVGIVLSLACAVFAGTRFAAAQPDASSSESRLEFQTITLRGRVVWLSDAMLKLYEVNQVPEAKDRVVVLQTPDRSLHPLLEDIRGRAFRRDPRLREMDVELQVRQYEGSPFVQVVRVFELRDGAKFEVDYWCQICSIAMYELKECECCQGPIELRKRQVPQSQP